MQRINEARSQLFENINAALAGVAQWIERRPVNQRIAGSIPSQGTCLACGPSTQ